MAFTPDGKSLVSGSPDSNIIFWDIAQAKPEFTINKNFGYILSIAISPDGKRVAAGSEAATSDPANHPVEIVLDALISAERVLNPALSKFLELRGRIEAMPARNSTDKAVRVVCPIPATSSAPSPGP